MDVVVVAETVEVLGVSGEDVGVLDVGKDSEVLDVLGEDFGLDEELSEGLSSVCAERKRVFPLTATTGATTYLACVVPR
jgi:hypothetical protein